MKVLVLSCNTGAGHNACARALQEELAARGIPCDIRDALAFVSKEVSRWVGQGHVWLYRNMPKLYAGGYSYAEKHRSAMDDESAAYRLLTLGTKRLSACIVSQGYTHIVCTHLFPAMMLTHIQKEAPLPVRTAFVSTDYTASPGYEAVCVDDVFIPDESLTGEFTHPGMTGRLIASGIPVRKAFLDARNPQAARRALGIDPGHRHLLVMGGSMGCGPLKSILIHLSRILPADVDVSVVCGTNQKLSRKLNRRLGEASNFHIHDFVDDMALFMDSADLYLTKPGGLSVSESLARCLPMVLVPAVEGCEGHNRDFCIERGVARTDQEPEALAELCARLLTRPRDLEKMRAAIARTALPDPARRVCDCLFDEEGGTCP